MVHRTIYNGTLFGFCSIFVGDIEFHYKSVISQTPSSLSDIMFHFASAHALVKDFSFTGGIWEGGGRYRTLSCSLTLFAL